MESLPGGISLATKDNTYTFSFNKTSNIPIAEKNYLDIAKGSFIKTDKEGKIIQADLISSGNNARWEFNGKTYKFPGGGRLIYENGKVTLEIP